MIMLFEEFNLNQTLRALRDQRRKKEEQLAKDQAKGNENLVRLRQAEIRHIQDKIQVAKSKDKVLKAKQRVNSQSTQ